MSKIIARPIGMLMLFSAAFAGSQPAYSGNETGRISAVLPNEKCYGVVKDTEGEVIIGASVAVKGTTTGTITDLNGAFSLNGVRKGDVLVISFVGYKTQEFAWDGKELNIELQSDTQNLDEVVVVGYGTQKKVNVTGAVSTIDSKLIAARPVRNVAQALQGQIPGLQLSVGNGGGALNSELNVSIRGGGTIGAGSNGSPLILIDGIEGNMNSVNPNDIANISVLKDAASASIYGARAAFGVILITTKNGNSGKTRVSYSGNLRFSTAIQVPHMANSWEFANYYNAAAINGGGSPIFDETALSNIQKYMNGEFTDPSTTEYYGTVVNPDNNKFKNYAGSFANTDWFAEFYRKNAPSHEHNVNISGGNDKITYMLSGSFFDQQGLIRHGSDNFKRYTLNGKISAQLTSWAKMNFTTKWTREAFKRPTYLTGLFFHNIARRWPTCFVKDPYGNYAADMEIIQLREGGEQSEQKDLYTNQLQFVFEPIKDWHITVEGSMRQTQKKTQWAILPIYGHYADNTPYLLSWNGGAAGYSEAHNTRYGEDYYSTNIYTDYAKHLKGHFFKVMLGFNAELYKDDSLTGFGTNLITPSVPELNAAQENHKAYNEKKDYAIAGFFGRLNYNYQEKYLFEANLRYDGSSRFLGDKRWGLFPSFSAGWNIAREDFFRPLNGVIGTFKFRGSWGQLGNNNTKSYYPFYQAMPTGVKNSGWLIDGEKQNTAGLPGIVSNLLTWETVESWDLGFDWGMFDNRLTGSFSYYNRLTKNMVADSPNLPGVLGATPPKLNNADLKSYGWELEIAWRDQIKDFHYGVRLTLDDNQEKITRYYNPTGSLSTYYNGRMIGEIWGYTTVGIAQSQEQMDEHLKTHKPNWGSGWRAGDIMFADINGDGIINEGSNTLENHGDLKIIGNDKPRYKFGLTLDGEWKGIDFSVFLQGVLKRDYWLGGPYFWGASGGQWQSTAFKEHLDYWTPENPGAYYPRPDFSSGKNQKKQTGYLQNAAYLRIKNAQIGYTLPQAWTRKAGMEMVRVYVSGDNLLTFSNIISIFDPETLGGDWGEGKLYPLQRTISVGLNVNF